MSRNIPPLQRPLHQRPLLDPPYLNTYLTLFLYIATGGSSLMDLRLKSYPGRERRSKVPSQALSNRCCSLIWCHSAVFCTSEGENFYTFRRALIMFPSWMKDRVFFVDPVDAYSHGAWPLTATSLLCVTNRRCSLARRSQTFQVLSFHLVRYYFFLISQFSVK